MKKNADFDDIRPYYDDEVLPAIERLLKDAEFKRVVGRVFPEKSWESVTTLLTSFKNKHDFQARLIREAVNKVVEKTSASVGCAGFENIEKGVPYTYISNHRDIILDASLLCSLLIMNGYDTTEIAIGDNLLLHPWIEDLVRLNKSFIVKRGISIRQMMEVSAHLSGYIHFAVKEKKESVWISQREGRAKDSNDRTQESLLKMLAMGGDGDFLANIKALNIVPVALSYEYDPCDYLKAKEFQQKRDNPEFKKIKEDDLISMQTGLFGYKGNIHFQFGRPINPALEKCTGLQSKNEWITQIASVIDREIFRNYAFYPGNYIAYDRLWGNGFFSRKYTKEEVELFERYLHGQLEKIDLEQKDIPFLTEKILEMYANPVKNHLES
ncbi:MAG: 1-acyl-sn-glycerol-3-phosphate acyltransferase [Dysgonamonadaceae bacterium]|jgi:hypothetical protein|nr:1-acyl-sn-glycerol-3-phosphate acyltransferase [Dysgonamonadaceae bacterium]